MNTSHGHTGAKWGKSRMSPTYMAWNNARSKYSKLVFPANFLGPGGFARFLVTLGPKPGGAKLAVGEDGLFYWSLHANTTSRKQSATAPEVSRAADSSFELGLDPI